MEVFYKILPMKIKFCFVFEIAAADAFATGYVWATYDLMLLPEQRKSVRNVLALNRQKNAPLQLQQLAARLELVSTLHDVNQTTQHNSVGNSSSAYGNHNDDEDMGEPLDASTQQQKKRKID